MSALGRRHEAMPQLCPTHHTPLLTRAWEV